MKILVINWQDIKNPFSGGAEVHLHEIFKRIAAWGHDVTLFCCKHPDLPDDEIIDGIKVIRRGGRNFFNYLVPKYYKKRFINEHYDIIIDDINKIPFYTPLFVKQPLLAISHHFFGKSIYRESGLFSGLYVNLAEKIVDLVYRKTKFAVVSQSTLDEFLSRGFKNENFTIVQNAITRSDFPMTISIKNDRPTVSYFGRLKKYKSVDHLIKAFAIVIKQIPEAQLHILGRGDFRQPLEDLAERLNVSNNTVFFGFVSDEEKINLLSKAHCMVNTSMKEGWGITNIEANACGTPVISANVPGLRDSVKDGVSGLLYEYGNINQLADILIKLFNDKDLQNSLDNGAIEWANSFSWDDSAKTMLELIQNCVK